MEPPFATLKLQEPVPLDPPLDENGPEVLEELRFRHLTAADIWDFPDDPTRFQLGHLFRLAGRLAGIPEERIEAVVGELGMADLKRMHDLVLEPETLELNAGVEEPFSFDPRQPFELELRAPPKLGSELVKTLSFRRLKAKDIWGHRPAVGSVGSTLEVASRLTGRPEVLFRRLLAADVGRVLGVTRRFLSAFRSETGAGA